MKDISSRQKSILERLAQPERLSMGRILDMLLSFFRSEREQDEPLDPQWLHIWESVRERARGLVPPPIFQEIELAISKIETTDATIWDLRLNEEDAVTILLGAGASAPPPSSIPTVGDLLPELWRRAIKIGRDDLDRLADWCKTRGVRNIEDLLTAAYIANFSAKNSSVTALLDYFLFTRHRAEEEEEYLARRGIRPRGSEVDTSSIALLQDTLQTLFGLLTSTMILAKPNSAHVSIAKLIHKRPKTTVVTTNYDGCMDEAFLTEGIRLDGSAGSTLAYEDAEDIRLIKMHGSINWSYCDSCQDVRDFSLLDLKKAYETDSLSYAVIGICRACGGLRRPLLVPPLSIKFMMFPNLVSLWNNARRSIESSKLILVVGYSFSEADTYISKMISRSLALRKDQKIIVCDTNNSLVPNIRKRFSAHIEGFEETRVLASIGSCEKSLPEILGSLCGEKVPTTLFESGQRQPSP